MMHSKALRLARAVAIVAMAAISMAASAWTVNTNLFVPIGSTGTYTFGNIALGIAAGQQGPVTMNSIVYSNPTVFSSNNSSAGNCVTGGVYGSSANVGLSAVPCLFQVNFTPNNTGELFSVVTFNCSTVSSAGGAAFTCDGVDNTFLELVGTGLQGGPVPALNQWMITLLSLGLVGWAMLRIRKNAV